MNGCETMLDELKAYLDGELPLVRRIALRLHIARCAPCRKEISAMENISREMRAGEPVGGLDPALRAKILSSVPEAAPDDAPAPPANLPAWRRRPLALWGAAATLLLAWFIMFPVFNQVKESASMTGGATLMGAKVSSKYADKDGASRLQNQETKRIAGLAQDSAKLVAGAEPAAPAAGGMSGPPPAKSKAEIVAMPTPVTVTMPTQDYDEAYAPRGRDNGKLSGKEMARGSVGRAVHKEGDITVEVAKLEEKSDAVEQMVKEAGGYVANNNLTTADDGAKTASLTVKVPVNQFETMMGRFAKLGEVKAKNVVGEDITEQTSDEKQAQRTLNEELEETKQKLQEARSRTQKREEAANIRDLKVQIAQAEGRLELLRKQAALSTITVNLREKSKPTPIKGGGFLDDMSDTGRAAVNSFLLAARLPVLLLIWLLAYAPVWVPLAIAYRYAARAQKRRVAVRETQQWQNKWSHPAEPDTPA